MQVAVVDGSMTALVLHHYNGLVSLVGGVNLKILQCDVVCLVQSNHTIILLVLVVAIAASGVVVMINLHVALSAFTFQCESVLCAQTLDVWYAHLLVILASLYLQCHRTVHAQPPEVVNGTLDGCVCPALANGIFAVFSACNRYTCRCRIGDADCLVASHDAGKCCLCRLSYLGIGIHVIANPEVVRASLVKSVTLAELLYWRERRGIACAVDVLCADSIACSGDVERREVDSALVGIALGHHLYFQHLHVALAFQHLVSADVLGHNADNLHRFFLVSLCLDGEVRTCITACSDILDGEFSAILIRIRNYWVELSRRTRKVSDEFLIVYLAALIYIKVCGISERDAPVGKTYAGASILRCEGDGACQSVSTVLAWTTVVIECGELSERKGYGAIVAFGNQYHVLQSARTLWVAVLWCGIGAGIHAYQFRVDGLSLGSVGAHVSLHGEHVVALFQSDWLT